MKTILPLLCLCLGILSCNEFAAPHYTANTTDTVPVVVANKKQTVVTFDTLKNDVIAITPYNDAANVSPYTTLEWRNVTGAANTLYHVFFDSTFPPTCKIAETYATELNLPTLKDSTFYYWYVVTEEGGIARQSKTFMFRTIPIDQATTTGLLAYYPFNGNANDVLGKHHGEVIGNAVLTSDRYGNPGAAFMFDGKSQYIRVKNSTELNFTNTYTLSVWVKPSLSVGNPFLQRVYLVSYWGDGGRSLAAYALSLTSTLTPVSMIHDGVFTTQFLSPISLQADEWSHVVITRDMNSAMHIYINGKQVAVQSMNSPQNSVYDLLFGASFTSGNNTCAYFAGCMDNIRIYNRSLSTGEIKYLYERGL